LLIKWMWTQVDHRKIDSDELVFVVKNEETSKWVLRVEDTAGYSIVFGALCFGSPSKWLPRVKDTVGPSIVFGAPCFASPSITSQFGTEAKVGYIYLACWGYNTGTDTLAEAR
jgi:hypothetical protein